MRPKFSMYLVLFLTLIFVVTFAPKNSYARKLVFLGDSLAAGYGVSKDAAFPSIIAAKLKSDGIEVQVVNASVSGSTTASALKRLKWQLKGKPTHIFLALGANDGLRGVELSATEKNLIDTIELAQGKGIKILLAGMELPMNYGEEYRNGFSSIYKKIANSYKLPLIPFLLKGVGGEKSFNQEDGIHPNREGHAKIAETAYPYIKSFL